MRRYIFILILLFVFLPIFGQSNDIAVYLDDNGRSTTKNIIKTDLTDFLQANIPIIWEHRFNDFFALQTGFGLLTNSFFSPVYTPKYSVSYSMYDELNSGLSLHLSPVIYTHGFESLHFGIPFNLHFYTGQALSYNFSFTVGKQWFVSRRIAIDIETGIGLEFEKSLDGSSYIYDPDINNIDKYGGEGLRLLIPLSIKLGYIL